MTVSSPSAVSRLQTEKMLSRHGGDIYALSRKLRRNVGDLIDFSSNTHIFSDSITMSLVQATPYSYEHYPDSESVLLRETLALHENCDPGCILAGNGSSELLWLTYAALTPRKIVFIGPIFSEYVRAALLCGIDYEIITPPDSQDFIPGPKELRAIWDSSADLAVICTPNNPAGTSYPNIAEIFETLRVPRVLVDATYREFLYGWPDYAMNNHAAYQRYARPGVNVFTLNSFTKFFMCPGIRLGYILGDAAHIGAMSKRRPPWMVSPFAETMGKLFLTHIGAYRDQLSPLRKHGEHMAVELRRNGCFDPDRVFLGPSFVTARLAGNVSAAKARETLLQRGMIVRDCDSIPGMPDGYLRMQVRPSEDMTKLLDVLAWHGERGW